LAETLSNNLTSSFWICSIRY